MCFFDKDLPETENLHKVRQNVQINICTINVQSMNNKISNLEIFTSREKPNFLCITEHWCEDDNIDMMTIQGYNLVAGSCRQRVVHGGSAIFMKSDKETIVKKINCSEYSVELHVEVCACIVDRGSEKVGIICIYRPPTGDIGLFLK